MSVDGVEYLTDAWMSSFKVLPLKPGAPASTGDGIHDIRAVPIDNASSCYLTRAGTVAAPSIPP